jgi:hypothetical protein
MKAHTWVLTSVASVAVCFCALAQEDAADVEIPPVRVQWPTADHPEVSPIAGITTYSEDYLDRMDKIRRAAGSASIIELNPKAMDRAKHYRDVLDNEGPAALAKAMVAAYPEDGADVELAAGAMAMAARTGYMAYGYGTHLARIKGWGLPKERAKELGEKARVDPEALREEVSPVIDQIEEIDSPYARDVAAEMLLQVFAETLGSAHYESHNGRREIEPMPRELTARAAGFLDSDDPFTRAVADWAVNVNVGNENETRPDDPRWPGDNPPEWWMQWTGIPESEHLALDYARQAISLQMHRHGEDLLTLSKDQMRRAEEKAKWAKPQVSDEEAEKIDGLVSAMKEAHAKFAAVVESSPDDLTACRKAYLGWRLTVRSVAMRGPDMDFDEIVYTTRPSGGNHGQPMAHQASWFKGRAGDIFAKAGLEPDSPRRGLIGDRLPPRCVQDLDLWFDADKVVFAAATNRGKWQLYEVDLQGDNVTQLRESNYDDCDPAYLPDGGVVYASTESQTSVMCVVSAGSPHTNIYRLNPDRSEHMRLSYCKDDDAYPYVLNDGRVAWMRWDYQERGVDEIFSLWVIRPDGTGADAFFRVHIPEPVIVQALRDPQPIENSQKIIAIGASHRTGNEGMLIVAAPTMGINNPLAIRTVTPYTTPTTYGVGELMRPVAEGGVPYLGGVATKPWALSEKSFLVSMSYDMPDTTNFWLYYVDAWGNKELIHRDLLLETICGRPLKPREKPPVLPDMSDPSRNYATCYVDNVYADLPGVEKGEVKYIRILRNMGWPGPYQFHPLNNPGESFGYPGTGGAVQVIGTVPVEEDGSAYFEVPAAMDVYFQALDKDYRAVQRMRTHVEFGRGENRSCIGCHETRQDAVVVRPKGLALERPAKRPEAPPWGNTRFIDYEEMIQPVFEEECVKCHSGKDPKAGLVLTAEKGNRGFMQGYRSIWGIQPGEEAPDPAQPVNGWREPFTEHPWTKIMIDYVNVRQSPVREERGIPNIPKRFGAIVHPFARKLSGDGKHAQILTEEERQLIMTWFDVQCPYYSEYTLKKRDPVVLKPCDPWGDSRDYIIEGE